jgi:hypothetical protein
MGAWTATGGSRRWLIRSWPLKVDQPGSKPKSGPRPLRTKDRPPPSMAAARLQDLLPATTRQRSRRGAEQGWRAALLPERVPGPFHLPAWRRRAGPERLPEMACKPTKQGAERRRGAALLRERARRPFPLPSVARQAGPLLLPRVPGNLPVRLAVPQLLTATPSLRPSHPVLRRDRPRPFPLRMGKHHRQPLPSTPRSSSLREARCSAQ